MMMAQRIGRLLLVCGLAFLPAAAWAQTLGGVAGLVKDASGAVLPGVTVEAASPALIEKVRTVVSDGQGQYKIVELPLGVYTMTFTLTGFSTVRREGVEVRTGFTATANADMRVGSIEETITVSGASPVVDVHNVRSQQMLSREVLDALPTSRTVQGYQALTLGATAGAGRFADVGGNRGDSYADLAIHGSRSSDMKTLLDGMRIETAGGVSGGIYSNYRINHLIVQEIVLETSGYGAEAQTGGVQMNVVPKDGGNTFSGVFAGAFTNGDLQSDNLTDRLRERGITTTPSVRNIYDAGGGVGGPLKRDKLWFYTGHRWWGASQYMPGAYFNKTQHSVFYTPDLSRPTYRAIPVEDHSIRLTWQAAEKHKISFFSMYETQCACYYLAEQNLAPEATEHVKFAVPTVQGSWSYPATNRLLFQGGVTYVYDNRWNARPDETSPTDIAITELSTGLRYGADPRISQIGYGYVKGDHPAGRVSASYVTGSHAFKAGYSFYFGRLWHLAEGQTPPIGYTFRKATPDALPTPISVTYSAAPQEDFDRVWDWGVHVQDQWTVRQKLTLNLGVRLDSLHAWVPAQTRPAGPFVQAFSFEKLDNVPKWKDLSPRVGFAYDVFGNGKSAVKASIGRYVIGLGTGLADVTNPANAIVTTATRNWNDANADYIPQENELGPLSPSTFGTVVVATRYAQEVLEGFNVRPYIWQGAASFQQELRPNVAVTAAYFRTSYGKFTATDNLKVTPADHDPYCVTAPSDPRLPGGGGYPICGLYDVRRSAFGAVDNEVKSISHFGKRTEVYNGVEFSVSARFGRGGLLSGGVSTARTDFDNCAVVDSPQLQFCEYALPFEGQTQFKLNGVYPLPWNMQASAVFQNLPGFPVAATRSFTNAEIAPSLGRNLSSCPTVTGACTSTAAVTLLEPNTRFEDRLTQVDFRLTKSFRFRQQRLNGMFDIYNLLNANTILTQNGTYGPTWTRPTEILAGRLFKFSVQFDF